MPDNAQSPVAKLFADAEAIAADGRLWEAADHLMAGFADLGDAADAPQVDGLGRPIRGSAPKLMDKAADYLEFLDQLESARQKEIREGQGLGDAAGDAPDDLPPAPPKPLRWAQWHTLNGLAEIRRGHPGRAIDHLELASGVFASHGMVAQALPLTVAIGDCQLDTNDLPRAEEALQRARELAARDPQAAEPHRAMLARLRAAVANRIAG